MLIIILLVIVVACLYYAMSLITEPCDNKPDKLPCKETYNEYYKYVKRRLYKFPEYPIYIPIPSTTKGTYASIGERCMVEAAEAIFCKKFVKQRPGWLRNPYTNRCLELDAFNEDLMIGLEYNGIQHYSWPNFTRCSENDHVKQIQRDIMKRQMCVDNGVCLICVPYTVKNKDMVEYIYGKLVESAMHSIDNGVDQ